MLSAFYLVSLFDSHEATLSCHLWVQNFSSLSCLLLLEVRVGQDLMLRGRLLKAASLPAPAVNWRFTRWVRGLSSGVGSAQWDQGWLLRRSKHVSLFSLCLCLIFYLPLSCSPQCLLSPLCVPLKVSLSALWPRGASVPLLTPHMPRAFKPGPQRWSRSLIHQRHELTIVYFPSHQQPDG